MPFTFSHPAAVLPLRKYGSGFFSFVGLVIGSMTPDAGYFLGLWRVSSLAHTPLGSIVVDVPIGLALALLFYGVRRPFSQLLPSPHREACLRACGNGDSFSTSKIFILAFSLFAGAWTHIAWDAFTHKGGWFVRQFPFLAGEVFRISENPVRVYSVLQHGCSVVGLFLLWQAYRTWLRLGFEPPPDRPEKGWRFVFWTALFLVPILPAGFFVSKFRGSLDSLFFHFVVSYLSLFMAGLLTAILCVFCLARTRAKV